MSKVIIVEFLFVYLYCVQCGVPPDPTSAVTDMLQVEFSTLRNTIKVLSDQWERWNTLFITSLEPRITSTASTLASIDSNIHNLQERAHVWDTFQLHVSAWNEQLASMDRKIDIISKGQEKVLSLDGKINALTEMGYKLDNAFKTINNIYDSVTNLDATIRTKKLHDTFFSEFATRGVLSSIKMVEKKLERLLLLANQQNLIKFKGTDDKSKFTVRCNTPRIVEDLLNDISSKVDVILDNVNINIDEEDDYDDEYLDVKAGSEETENYKQPKSKRSKKAASKTASCRKINKVLDEILNRAVRIENTSLVVLDKENTHFEQLSAGFKRSKIEGHLSNCTTNFIENSQLILQSYISEQKADIKRALNKISKKCNYLEDISSGSPTETVTTFEDVASNVYSFGATELTEALFIDDIFETTTESSSSNFYNNLDNTQPTWKPILNRNKSSCDELDHDDVSGVYIFENNVEAENSKPFFYKRYCEIRNDGLWTVIQRRDNYTFQHNFNTSWEDYKHGFGNLHRDFWIGNNFLHKISNQQNLILRIELEDFENNSVWAEYDNFAVASENDNFQLSVSDYTGNASDSFSSHSGSYFSTYDQTNDQAPECCPCSLSYGGGWWFNRCFESNLNGVYFKYPQVNNYFRGIIWEYWLGNYSLKKSVMMIKSKDKTYYENPTSSDSFSNKPFYEDP